MAGLLVATGASGRRRCRGHSTYRPDAGLALELIGGWDAEITKEVRPGVFDVLEDSRRWPVLHGRAENRQITLLDCMPTHTMSRNFGPPEEQTIHVLTALVGIHLDTADHAIFTECHVAVGGARKLDSFGGEK